MAECRSIVEEEEFTSQCLSCSVLRPYRCSRNDVKGESTSSILRTSGETGHCTTSSPNVEFTTSTTAMLPGLITPVIRADDKSNLGSKNYGLAKKTNHATVTQGIQDDGYFSPNFEMSSLANSESQQSMTDDDNSTTHDQKGECAETVDFKSATRQSDCVVRYDETSNQKGPKVRVASEELPVPAAKKFTRIVPRGEADGTPVIGARRLGLMYRTAMAEEDSGYGSPGMFVGRPCKVGREKLDIVTELGQHEPALLDKIFAEFSDEDIVRFTGVCREWRHSVDERKEIALRKRHFLQQKSKPRRRVKENYPRQSFQRATVSSSTPLGEVQRLGEPQASSTPASRPSSHDRFRQASQSLLADESLMKCARDACRSPAKLLMNGQRGQCTRCGYDFCTNCRCSFHASSVCPSLRAKNTAKRGHGAGSSKSKQNLRRLARLESYP